jgi:hypothetical protein
VHESAMAVSAGPLGEFELGLGRSTDRAVLGLNAIKKAGRSGCLSTRDGEGEIGRVDGFT